MVLGGTAIIVTNDPERSPGEFLFTPALFAIAWLVGYALRERVAQAQAAEERAHQAEGEREENARRAVFEERVRIARELHDVIAHHVSMMGVQAGAGAGSYRPRPGQGQGGAGRDRALEPPGGAGAAPAARLPAPGGRPRPPRVRSRASGSSPAWRPAMSEAELTVEVSIEGERRPLPATVDVSAYRIVQEALTNTLKHAGASRADVHLRYWPGELEVEIVDDGRPNGGPGGARAASG